MGDFDAEKGLSVHVDEHQHVKLLLCTDRILCGFLNNHPNGPNHRGSVGISCTPVICGNPWACSTYGNWFP
jgi:hypothetical protein